MGDDIYIPIFLDEKRKRLEKEFRDGLRRLLPELQKNLRSLNELILKYGKKIPADTYENSDHSLILLADAIVYIKRDLIKEEIEK